MSLLSKQRYHGCAFAIGAFGIVALFCPSHATAGTGVTIESVNDYSQPGCPGPSLANSIANGDGFRNGLVTGSGFWTAGLRYVDNGVYDGDFVDPQRSGDSLDHDDLYFDRAGDAISYFTGHGVCNPNAGATNVTCTSSAQCTSPMPGQSLPGNCKSAPGFPGAPAQGLCHYNVNRSLYTCSTGDHYNHSVNYSNTFVKWGESSSAGSWAGAGTNGGINLAVLDISCAVLPQFEWYQLGPLFAGLHIVATVMPVNGDLANVASRGSTFASRWAANASGVVTDAWMETMNNLPQTLGSACSDYTIGGGRGINGCGLYVAVTMDSTNSAAQWKMNTESWYGLQLDSNDGNGTSYWYTKGFCNYDCVTWPIILP
ncbi:hypothetical protein [Polyangium mundeleinium]|uniref:Uncharacterized protein n=1 Tax=Polyangium mundeleinium TaxID=2995306 RepID=A0ABT5EY05_9BACT|nr:hypothetical protein [Polyangium mundeleinium]MDC0746043.1 hypothetical protein [Polyangium mundeleinium]